MIDDDALIVATDPASSLAHRVAWFATHEPDRAYLAEVTGATRSYGEFWQSARAWASWLAALGVGPGQRVVTMLPSSIDAACAWIGLGLLGAVEVPVNPELTGRFLEHVLADAAPLLCLVRPEFVDLVTACRPHLRVVAVERGDKRPAVCAPLDVDRLPAHDDVACVIYTSGTTGAAKGVVLAWAQFSAAIGRIPRSWLRGDDATYACHPMFHVTGRTPLVVMADVGGRVVFRERFSASSFLADVRAHGCTSGTVAAALVLAQPETPDDADNPLRVVFGGHHARQRAQFARRFDTRVIDAYGSTEVGFPIILRADPPDDRHAWCGRLRPGYAAMIVDTADQPVADGTPGELWIRPPDRSLVMREYLNQPEATARAFADGWYRTGDLVVRHPSGDFEFRDRLKDTIRRMGENISSSAIEAVFDDHPDVTACAVLGVRDEVAGHEVLVVVEATGLTPEELYEWLRDRVPRYARPRYIVVTGSLPRTPTAKVRKADLLEQIDVAAAWSPPVR